MIGSMSGSISRQNHRFAELYSWAEREFRSLKSDEALYRPAFSIGLRSRIRCNTKFGS
jgi:hypothetical protein